MELNKDKVHYVWLSGSSQSKRIKDFLIQIDEIIIPRLSDRVDMGEYSLKLAMQAKNLFIMIDNEDIASCSVYCDGTIAYISSIAVKEKYQSSGIGRYMLYIVKGYVRRKGCKKIDLKVHKDNIHAFEFYVKNGFEIFQLENEWLKMRFYL